MCVCVCADFLYVCRRVPGCRGDTTTTRGRVLGYVDMLFCVSVCAFLLNFGRTSSLLCCRDCARARAVVRCFGDQSGRAKHALIGTNVNCTRLLGRRRPSTDDRHTPAHTTETFPRLLTITKLRTQLDVDATEERGPSGFCIHMLCCASDVVLFFFLPYPCFRFDVSLAVLLHSGRVKYLRKRRASRV